MSHLPYFGIAFVIALISGIFFSIFVRFLECLDSLLYHRWEIAEQTKLFLKQRGNVNL